MMRYRRRAHLCLALIPLSLLLAGCPGQQVLYQSEPITGTARSIAQAANVFETAATSAGLFIVSGSKAGHIPDTVLSRYALEIGPAIQLSLDSTRKAIKAYEDTKDADTFGKLQRAFSDLADAVETLSTFATQHGWIQP